jgi:hypothetical protein
MNLRSTLAQGAWLAFETAFVIAGATVAATWLLSS